MKRLILGMMCVLAVVSLAGCSGRGPRTLSNEYVKVTDYQGVEIEPVVVEETTDEEIESALDYMRRLYVRNNDMDEDAEITDEMVQELSQTSTTVDEYKAEIRGMIESSKEETAREEEETRVWEKVIDNSTVKKYPEDRLEAVKSNLVDLYDSYAAQSGKTYEEYMEAVGMTDDDLQEAAEASLKQELVADIIADHYGLKPTEEEYQQGLQEYVDKYNLTNIDVLLATVSEEDMRVLIIQNNVVSWLTDRCRYVDADEQSGDSEEDAAEETVEEEEVEAAEKAGENSDE